MSVLTIAFVTFSATLLVVYAGPTAKPNNSSSTPLGSLKQNGIKTAFYLSNGKANWDDAVNACRDKLQGRLLSIRSISKENEIKAYLSGRTVDYIWTTGVAKEGSKQWKWILNNGEEIKAKYTNFKSGVTPKTGPDYRVAYHNGPTPSWQSLPIKSLNYFICEVDQI